MIVQSVEKKDNSREAILSELSQRAAPRRIELNELQHCPRSEYVGRFPSEADYDRVIDEDCDVYVAGRKVISFRKSLLPHLKEGSQTNPTVWEFFRKASREVYGTQRGVVAGSELTSKPESRLTKGQVAFFVQSAAGLVTTLSQAKELLESSSELTTKTLKIKYIKKEYPEVANLMFPLESALKKKDLTEEQEHLLRLQRREQLWSWFDPWLTEVWLPAEDKPSLTKSFIDNFVSTQLSFNHCYSNVLGAVDRGARFPYGRLSGTTQRNYHLFAQYRDIYASACESFRYCFPETWGRVRGIISQVKDPVYNLFGTAFTSITLNFNFRTAYHVDKNNLHGGLAVLSVITQGDYTGHYLVFPEVRLAFNLRDGDFIVGDTQTLLHGNTPMEKLSNDAERVSLVFYSRENMTLLDSLECEQCRRDFLKFSVNSLKEKGKTHKDWRGVWPEMWISQEWLDYRKSRGLDHCSNSNWQLSSPYKSVSTGEVKLFKKDPGPGWEHIEVWSF